MDIMLREVNGLRLAYLMDGDRPIYASDGVNCGLDAAQYAADNNIKITRLIKEYNGYERVQLPDDTSLLF